MSTAMSESNAGSSGPKPTQDEEWKEKYRQLIKNFVPYDPRFPNQNQTRNCQTNYIDYHRCLHAKNGDEEYCGWYKHAYKTLCPPEWYEKWDEQLESGTFPVEVIQKNYKSS